MPTLPVLQTLAHDRARRVLPISAWYSTELNGPSLDRAPVSSFQKYQVEPCLGPGRRRRLFCVNLPLPIMLGQTFIALNQSAQSQEDRVARSANETEWMHCPEEHGRCSRQGPTRACDAVTQTGRQIEVQFAMAAECLIRHDLVGADRHIQRGIALLSGDGASGLSLSPTGWELLAVQALFKMDTASCELWLKQSQRRAVSLASAGSSGIDPSTRSFLTDDAYGNARVITACMLAGQCDHTGAIVLLQEAIQHHQRSQNSGAVMRDLILMARIAADAGQRDHCREALDRAERIGRQLETCQDVARLLRAVQSDRQFDQAVRHAASVAIWN